MTTTRVTTLLTGLCRDDSGRCLRLAAAFGAVYLIWGSTYLAIRVAIETIPPFVMAGSRFLLAGDGGRYLGDPDSLGPDAGSYVVFGRTVRGLEVLEAIAALDDGTGRPSTAVTIESVVITES